MILHAELQLHAFLTLTCLRISSFTRASMESALSEHASQGDATIRRLIMCFVLDFLRNRSLARKFLDDREILRFRKKSWNNLDMEMLFWLGMILGHSE